jgi:organic radical activating enzyme
MVDWNIGNTCSLKCDYCHADFHRGNSPFPDLDKAKIIVNRIAERHRGSNRAVRFSLIGGEPTEWAHLPELLAYIKAVGFSTEIKTNGVADWNGFRGVLDDAVITHHNAVPYHSLKASCETLREMGVGFVVSMPIRPTDFDDVLTRFNTFRTDFPDVYCDLQLLYADYPRRHILMDYDAEQMRRFQETCLPEIKDHVVVTDSGDTIERNLDDMIATGDNRCAGMLCRIGADQVVIDQDGSIRRGWCRVGGLLGTVQNGDFDKPTDAVVCTRARCNNPLDLSVVKYAQSEAY